MFCSEIDLLDIRLHELADVVDYFVLVEATKTHSGLQKPRWYEIYQDRFRDYKDQIIHIVVDDMPMTPEEIQLSLSSKDKEWILTGYQVEDAWVRERHQRNCMMRGLVDAKDDDIIIIEDADEMVRHDVVATLEQTIVDGSNAVGQALHTYFLNWKCTNMPWWGTKILRKKFISTPSEDRFHTVAAKYFPDSGYHFNYLGGPYAIREKIKAFAHQEFNKHDVLDSIEQKLYLKKDALGRLYEYEVVPIDESYPKYIQENQEKFKHLIYKE